jgi:hypothetical protein
MFLHEEEIIHSKVGTLRFHAFIKVLEVHDFSPPVDSDDNFQPSSDFSNDSDDGYPGCCGHGQKFLGWPATPTAMATHSRLYRSTAAVRASRH